MIIQKLQYGPEWVSSLMSLITDIFGQVSENTAANIQKLDISRLVSGGSEIHEVILYNMPTF